MIYSYMFRTKDGKVTESKLEARHILEALHNARFSVLSQGGDIRGLVIRNSNAIA